MNEKQYLEILVNEHNLPIFPVNPKTKRPLSPSGFKDATTDWDQIAKWKRQRSDCGWAVPTGVRTGIVVIDKDVDKSGVENWDRLVRDNESTPPTVVVKTQSGGEHEWYRLNGNDIRNSASLLADGVDVRGTGGYVVVPPTPGYEFTVSPEEIDVAVIPAWLEDKLASSERSESGDDSWFHKGRTRIKEGERNDTLFRTAAGLRDKGLTRNQILGAIAMENDEKCDPPLEWDELEKIAESASKYEPEIGESGLDDRGEMTDLGNAIRFANEYGDRIRYSRGLGWLVFEGGRWVHDADLQVKSMAQKFAQDQYKRAASADTLSSARAWGSWARQSMSRRAISAMIDLAAPRLAVKADQFDSYPELLNVKNGVVNLATGELLPHDPELLLTQQANVEFDPDADCPKWESMLEMVFQGDGDLIRYLQMGLGWTAGGRTDIKAIFFMYGPAGDNGKSTITKTLLRLLGDYAIKAPISALMRSAHADPNELTPHLASLRGKRFVVGSEVKYGMAWDDGLIKDLTGNDPIAYSGPCRSVILVDADHRFWTMPIADSGSCRSGLWPR